MNDGVYLLIEKLETEHPSITVLRDMDDLLIYAHGCYPVEYKWLLQGPYKYLPSAVLMPNNTAEVSAVLSAANELGVGVIPLGGCSGIVGGSIPENGEVIVDVRRLQSVEIDPVSCTVTAGAGTIGADLENYLNERGFTCGHYPQSFQSAALGGMVATRAIGTFSTKYGKMDDIVNSLEAVLPDGRVYRSHRTPKASSGPSLDQLFLGSEGVYGIVTRVEMKIYPLPEKRVFEAYTFKRTEDGLKAVREMVQHGVLPAVVRLYDEEEAASKIAKYGYPEGDVLLFLGYEGLARRVELDMELAAGYCQSAGGVYRGEKPGNDWFGSRFSTKKMLDHDAIRGGTSDAIEVSAPWDRIVDVWREMRRALAPLCYSVDCHFSHVYHTGASVYVIFHSLTNGDDFDGERRYLQCLDIAIKTSAANGGNVSHHHGVGKAKAAYMPLEHGETGVWMMSAIKRAVDPKGLINKGVLGI